MAAPVGPSFIPKAALTTGRVLHQPFEVPTEMTKSALLQGGAIHSAVGAFNKTASEAVQALEPRGPAKFLEKLFGKVDSSLVGSAAQAQKATEVFWVPFSNGTHEVGHSVSNPFSMFYAKRAGFDIPSDPAEAQKLLQSITDPDPKSTKFPGFTWPAPPPPAEGEKPAAEGETPPVEGETPPPAQGEKPAPEGETPPPAEGEKPPADGATPPPAEGETVATAGPAPAEGETPAPVEGEAGGAPAADQEAAPAAAAAEGPTTESGDVAPSTAAEGTRSLAPIDPGAPTGATTNAAAGADATAVAPTVTPVTDEAAPTPAPDAIAAPAPAPTPAPAQEA